MGRGTTGGVHSEVSLIRMVESAFSYSVIHLPETSAFETLLSSKLAI